MTQATHNEAEALRKRRDALIEKLLVCGPTREVKREYRALRRDVQNYIKKL